MKPFDQLRSKCTTFAPAARAAAISGSYAGVSINASSPGSSNASIAWKLAPDAPAAIDTRSLVVPYREAIASLSGTKPSSVGPEISNASAAVTSPSNSRVVTGTRPLDARS